MKLVITLERDLVAPILGGAVERAISLHDETSQHFTKSLAPTTAAYVGTRDALTGGSFSTN